MYAHIAIWAIQTGEFPPTGMEVDHKNRDKLDNRWSNLRLATESQQRFNGGLKSNNKSGHTGVCRKQDRGGEWWGAYVTLHGKHHHLGHFRTIEEAIAAREEGVRKLAGEFAP